MSDWMTPFDGSGVEWHEGLPSPYTYQASDFSKLVAAVHEYESALREAREREATLLKVVQGVVSDAGNVLIPQTFEAVDASLRAILEQRDLLQAALAVSPPADEAKR